MRSPIFVSALLALLPSLTFADTKEPTAFDCGKAIMKAVVEKDAGAFEACCHGQFWSAPSDNGKLLFKQLTGMGLTPRLILSEQRVIGLRSLLPLSLSKDGRVLGRYFILLEYSKGRWGVSAVDDSKPRHDKWLQAGFKQGATRTAKQAVDALIGAIATKNKESARRHVTEAAWNKPGDTLSSLYHQALRKQLGLILKGPVQERGSRAIALVNISYKGRLVDLVVLYLVKRSSGWLIGGIDEDEQRGQRYLAGKSAAKPWPTRRDSLGDAFGDWRRGRQLARSLWTDAAWSANGEKLYERLLAATPKLSAVFPEHKNPQPTGSRAVLVAELRTLQGNTLQETLYLLAEQGTGGWRLMGVAKDEAAAQAWIKTK
jgi:hypothetical protein